MRLDRVAKEMRKASDRALLNGLRVLKGPKKPGGVVVFSIMKNEMYFLRAFLAYYRSLGVDHFLILDDQSGDGTLEFLLEQGDVTVLQSEYAYGEVYERRARLPWRSHQMRAGIRLKALIPNAFLSGKWCLYADADEFLILPPTVKKIGEFLDTVNRHGISVIPASVVEFYPAEYTNIAGEHTTVNSFDDLLIVSPFFDAVSLLELDSNGTVVRQKPSASGRLFSLYGVHFGGDHETHVRAEALDRSNAKQLAIGSAIHKIPLISPSSTVRLKSGHRANIPFSDQVLLSVAHFKFTPDVLRRRDEAVRTQAWSQSSAKYSKYDELFRKMAEGDGSFLGPDSTRYHAPNQLSDCGNLWTRLG